MVMRKLDDGPGGLRRRPAGTLPGVTVDVLDDDTGSDHKDRTIAPYGCTRMILSPKPGA